LLRDNSSRILLDSLTAVIGRLSNSHGSHEDLRHGEYVVALSIDIEDKSNKGVSSIWLSAW
jgi:hypothetical protein